MKLNYSTSSHVPSQSSATCFAPEPQPWGRARMAEAGSSREAPWSTKAELTPSLPAINCTVLAGPGTVQSMTLPSLLSPLALAVLGSGAGERLSGLGPKRAWASPGTGAGCGPWEDATAEAQRASGREQVQWESVQRSEPGAPRTSWVRVRFRAECHTSPSHSPGPTAVRTHSDGGAGNLGQLSQPF